MLETSHLQTLAAVVEAGTFSQAQRHLRVTQPALSKRIKALEAAVGQPVLLRTTPLRATEIGQQLIAHYRYLEMVQTALLERLGTVTAGERWSRLAIALNTESLSTWFIPAVRPWLEQRRLVLHLYVDDQERTDLLLRSGKVVGCITSRRKAASNCVSHPLGSMIYRCVCTREFRRQYFRGKVTAKALLAAPVVVYGEDDHMHQGFLKATFPGYAAGIPNVHYVPSPQGITEFARQGLAYALLPELVIKPDLRDRSLVEVCRQTYHLDLYWHVYDADTPILRELTLALLACARQTLR